ncbi:MAG: integrase [Candidatus Bathyarchaeia archaeon]
MSFGNLEGNGLSVKECFNQSYGGIKEPINASVIDWNYVEGIVLREYSSKYARRCLSFMKRYYRVILDSDASILYGLSPLKRLEVMKALSILARILGLKDKWRRIREAYGLKWSIEMDPKPPILSGRGYNALISEASEILRASGSYRCSVEFIALSGLRVSEALEAMSIYSREKREYLNEELMVLEHFKYPRTFIRRTKRAYITVLDDYMVKLLESGSHPTYNALRMMFRRRFNGRCRLNIFRKIWATYMRRRGVDSEVIDLLQGRTPRSIFLKHYYRPDMAQIIRDVRDKLQGLRMELGIS